MTLFNPAKIDVHITFIGFGSLGSDFGELSDIHEHAFFTIQHSIHFLKIKCSSLQIQKQDRVFNTPLITDSVTATKRFCTCNLYQAH